MAHKRIHQGEKLKRILLSNPHHKVNVVAGWAGVARQTIHNYFNMEEIPYEKLKKILDAVGADVDEFYGIDTGDDPLTTKMTKELEKLKVENKLLSDEVMNLQRQLLSEKKPIKISRVAK